MLIGVLKITVDGRNQLNLDGNKYATLKFLFLILIMCGINGFNYLNGSISKKMR